jgi:hypothetical protein
LLRAKELLGKAKTLFVVDDLYQKISVLE